MQITYNLFPNGKHKALTMSYDDGVYYDAQLIEIFNNYGIKGTFHLNSGLFGKKSWDRLPQNEILSLYKGHEIAAHGYMHNKLTELSNEAIITEIAQDRKNLETLTGAPVHGFSYPYGSTNAKIQQLLSYCGIKYARVVPTTGAFNIPDNFLEWSGTCHHNEHLLEYGKQFLEHPTYEMSLMYVWGHSFEFPRDHTWGLMEEFCQMMSENTDIWFASNIEIYDYINALHSLDFTMDQQIVYNPTLIDVWISVNEIPTLIKSGAYLNLLNR